MKALYGLHQSPDKFKKEVIAWFKENKYNGDNYGVNSAETFQVWILRDWPNVLVHGLYADDFLHQTNNTAMLLSFQKQFKKSFDIKLGNLSVFLGNTNYTIVTDSRKLTTNIDQTQYIDELLKRFDVSSCNPAQTPIITTLSVRNGGGELSIKDHDHETYRNVLGSVLYIAAACWTRPDISFAFRGAKQSCCIRASSLCFVSWAGSYVSGKALNSWPMNGPTVLWGNVDSDWAGCADSRRSTSRWVFMLNGTAVSWKSERQPVVALSSAEAEIIAPSALVQEVIYAHRAAASLKNSGFLSLILRVSMKTTRPALLGRRVLSVVRTGANHIDLRLREHFVHDAEKAKTLKLMPIATMDNVADLLTKPPPKAAFLTLRKRLMGL